MLGTMAYWQHSQLRYGPIEWLHWSDLSTVRCLLVQHKIVNSWIIYFRYVSYPRPLRPCSIQHGKQVSGTQCVEPDNTLRCSELDQTTPLTQWGFSIGSCSPLWFSVGCFVYNNDFFFRPHCLWYLVSLTIGCFSGLYFFTVNVGSNYVKMLMFYYVHTTNLIFVGK